jgi:long-chain acyl-CoA synthetase
MDQSTESAQRPWNVATVAHMYVRMGTAYKGLTALVSHANNDVRDSLTYDEMVTRSLAIAEGLISLGLEKGDRVMILADNRLEWMVSSMATSLSGGVDVPRGNDATSDEVNYILSHSASKFLVVENRKHFERILHVVNDIDALVRVIIMDDSDLTDEQLADEQVTTLNKLASLGKSIRSEGNSIADERIASITAEDPYTMIYTSGTTGRPKGVVLSNANMMSQVQNLPIEIETGWRVLSILPIWHSYERAFELMAIARGIEMTYSSIKTIGADMKEVKPQLMVSAPRLWENVYSRIQHNIRSSSIVKRALFKTAYGFAFINNTAMAVIRDSLLEVRHVGLIERLFRKLAAVVVWLLSILPYLLFDKIVFSKLRAVIGGCFVCTVSGGGALPLHIDKFFNYIGIRVLEGYGMTESSPVLSVRLFDKLVIGTVGPVWPNTELRIVHPDTKEVIYPNTKSKHGGRGIKGEIHVKGPQVMTGYFRSPEETAKVVKDEWLNTGDLGMITFNDCIKIVGRTKDTVVLLSGENIEPVPIENKIVQSDLVDNCMVIGQDQKYLGLLVVPSEEGFKELDDSLGSIDAIIESKLAKEKMDQYIHEVISPRMGFKSFERIHSWRWVEKPFEIGDEMTSTFKLKRHVITSKYADKIESMAGSH